MEQVIVEHYEFYTNESTGEVRFLFNFEYLIALESETLPAFKDSVVMSNETLTMPVQRMEAQKILSPSHSDDDVSVDDMNYYIEDSNLSDYHRGDVELAELVFPRHEDAAEFLTEVEFLAELELALPHQPNP